LDQISLPDTEEAKTERQEQPGRVSAFFASETGLLCAFLMILALASTAYYLPWLDGQRSFYRSDITYYFQPLLQFIGESFRAGRLPLWNPYLYCGMSEVAIPSPGIFYLPDLLFAIENFNQALALYLILHGLVAAAGGYLLAVKCGLGRLAGLVLGLCAALNGYMLTMVSNFTLMAGAAWLPAVTLGMVSIRSGYSRGNVFWWAATSFFTAMLILSGRPEIFAPSMALLSCFIVVDGLAAIRWSMASGLKQIGWRLAAFVAGMLLAAPMLLPAIEWWQLSYRAQGLEPHTVFLWSANWFDVLSMFCMQPLGDVTSTLNPLAYLVTGRSSFIPYVPSAYLGPIAATLAFFGLCDFKCKSRFWLLAAAVSAGIIAAGKNTPLAPYLVAHFNIFSAFRYPVKLIVLPVFCLCILAAFGINAVWEKRLSRTAIGTAGAIWFAVWGIGLWMAGASQVLAPIAGIPVQVRPDEIVSETLLSLQQGLGLALLGASTIGLGAVVLSAIYHLGWLERRAFGALMILGLCFTLVVPPIIFPPGSSKGDYFLRSALLANFIRPGLFSHKNGACVQRYLCLAHEPFYPTSDSIHAPEEDAYPSFGRFMLYANTPSGFAIPSAGGYEGSETGRYKGVHDDVLPNATAYSAYGQGAHGSFHRDMIVARFCKIAAVAFVGTQNMSPDIKSIVIPPMDGKYFKTVARDERDNCVVYRVLDTNTRVYFAKAFKWGDRWTPYLDELFNFRNSEVSDQVYLRGGPGIKPPDVVPASNKQNNSIIFEKDDPDCVRLRVHAGDRLMLVLCDTHYPGWKATVDGASVYIYKANVFFRAVAVPAGDHVVEFRYQPDSLYCGLVLAALALVAGLIMWLRAPRIVSAESGEQGSRSPPGEQGSMSPPGEQGSMSPPGEQGPTALSGEQGSKSE
jgi:hypothetical protein